MGRLRSKRKAKLRQQQQEELMSGDDAAASNNLESAPPPACSEFTVGVNGVRLKHFERVLAYLLPKIEPDYTRLPPLPPRAVCVAADGCEDADFPFGTLPSSARVFGDSPGQLNNLKRARRKEGQLQSMMRCILPLVSAVHQQRMTDPFTIVDFGGGSGHLGIPLALMLPQCRVIVVDFNERSIQLMHEKVKLVIQQIQNECSAEELAKLAATRQASAVSVSIERNPLFRCCSENLSNNTVLANLFSFQGPVEQFHEPFDMLLALHLCGEATDVAVRKALGTQASAMVLAPCCVGKLSQKAFNSDVFNATGRNESTITYPQSSLFCQLVGGDADDFIDKSPDPQRQQDDWDALAKAADYSNEGECGTSRNATRRTAKALLETDRRLFLEEQKSSGGYRTALTKMDPFDVTPKNDILVAWRSDMYGKDLETIFSVPNSEYQQDIEVAKSHLVTAFVGLTTASNDWTSEEGEYIESIINTFLEETSDFQDCTEHVYVFPTKMGARQRKLIHFVAEKMDLAHWSLGDKDSLKTVAVARRGRRRQSREEFAKAECKSEED